MTNVTIRNTHDEPSGANRWDVLCEIAAEAQVIAQRSGVSVFSDRTRDEYRLLRIIPGTVRVERVSNGERPRRVADAKRNYLESLATDGVVIVQCRNKYKPQWTDYPYQGTHLDGIYGMRSVDDAWARVGRLCKFDD
jgi:hypothetical protein